MYALTSVFRCIGLVVFGDNRVLLNLRVLVLNIPSVTFSSILGDLNFGRLMKIVRTTDTDTALLIIRHNAFGL